jgi:chromosomal replication initiation ATPase DnaA
MSVQWERDEGDRLREAIARRAARGARARLMEMGQVVRKAKPEPKREPTEKELITLLDSDDEAEWRPGVNDILKAFQENYRRMVSHQRDFHIVKCRVAVALYLRKRGWSYQRIANFMKRDHSSIVHLVEPERKRERYIKVRDLSKAALDEMERVNA